MQIPGQFQIFIIHQSEFEFSSIVNALGKDDGGLYFPMSEILLLQLEYYVYDTNKTKDIFIQKTLKKRFFPFIKLN